MPAIRLITSIGRGTTGGRQTGHTRAYPGIPVDLQTSGDRVLLVWAELNSAEAEFAALR
jgi:hypothetical protein